MIYNDGPALRIPIRWGEDDLADRWLVDVVVEDGTFGIDLLNSRFNREQHIRKIRDMTTGKFFFDGRYIQFEDEIDYINFRLAV